MFDFCFFVSTTRCKLSSINWNVYSYVPDSLESDSRSEDPRFPPLVNFESRPAPILWYLLFFLSPVVSSLYPVIFRLARLSTREPSELPVYLRPFLPEFLTRRRTTAWIIFEQKKNQSLNKWFPMEFLFYYFSNNFLHANTLNHHFYLFFFLFLSNLSFKCKTDIFIGNK